MRGIAMWLALLGSAALASVLAYILFFQILVRSGASNVTLVTLLIPVTTILLGYFAWASRSKRVRSPVPASSAARY
jgi:drug/metabolite transporter (DMT)-like permease